MDKRENKKFKFKYLILLVVLCIDLTMHKWGLNRIVENVLQLLIWFIIIGIGNVTWSDVKNTFSLEQIKKMTLKDWLVTFLLIVLSVIVVLVF